MRPDAIQQKDTYTWKGDDRLRLLWCSDAWQLPTGYANVSRNLLDRFSKTGMEVNYLCFQNAGFPSSLLIVDRMVALYNMFYPLHPNEAYGNMGSVEFWNNDLKPDITGFLADSFMIRWLADKIEHQGKSIKRRDKLIGKTLFYFPLDSKDIYDGVKQVMEVIDIKVAMSKWAQRILKKDADIESHYIPHAVNNMIFRPLNEEDRAKIKAQNKWEGKFVVGSVGRNQSRKNIPNLMKAFQIFSEGKKDAVLFLYCDPVDPNGTNLFDMASKLKISDKVVFGMKRFSLGIPEPQMNLAYNSMDIHALSTTGEGFGIPIIESMSCGVPNICTNYTTAEELLKGRGELASLAKGSPYIVGQLNTDRALVDYEDMARKMDKLYSSDRLRKTYSKLGRKHVVKNYSWERVCRMWMNLLEKGEANDI